MRIMDDGHYELLDELHDAIQRCRLRGFDIQVSDLHPLSWYQPIVKRLLELPKTTVSMFPASTVCSVKCVGSATS